MWAARSLKTSCMRVSAAISASATVVSKGRLCTADCGSLVASCETPPLAAGTFDLGEIYDRQYDDVADFVLAADLAGPKSDCLLPMENVRAALMRFEETRLEALPVLAAGADPRVIGYMTEAYALRRYTEEMERRRREEENICLMLLPRVIQWVLLQQNFSAALRMGVQILLLRSPKMDLKFLLTPNLS